MTGINIGQADGKLTRNGLQALMDLYSESLFLFVRGIVRSNETAEELVSDVFVKLWNKKEELTDIRNIRSYLFVLARNESISFIRKNKQKKTVGIDEISDYDVAPLENDGSELFDQEVIDRINQAIESLPTKCKMAFSLAKINNLKYKEIGEIMGISPLTVKNHIAYALEKICSEVGISRKGNMVNHSDVFLFIFGDRF
ncbi:MAG: RNA polymerase sigma factor [Mangrovibacterium sp.]